MKKALRAFSTQQNCHKDEVAETAYSTEWDLKDFYPAWCEPSHLFRKEPKKEVSQRKGKKRTKRGENIKGKTSAERVEDFIVV